MNEVTKVTDTSIKISRVVENILPLKQIKMDRQMTIEQLDRLDKQYQVERQQLVNQISALDKIIVDAGKVGVVDELKAVEDDKSNPSIQ